MSIQIKRIGNKNYKYEVTWDEKSKKQRWRYIGKVNDKFEHVGKPENPEFLTILKYFFYFSLGIIFLLGFFIQSHPYFWWDEHPAFYAIFGFVICVAIILGSKALGHYIKREEDYYD